MPVNRQNQGAGGFRPPCGYCTAFRDNMANGVMARLAQESRARMRSFEGRISRLLSGPRIPSFRTEKRQAVQRPAENAARMVEILAQRLLPITGSVRDDQRQFDSRALDNPRRPDADIAMRLWLDTLGENGEKKAG